MKEIEKMGIKTSNKQPVKEISYQHMYRLGDTLEQLRSWQEPLCVLEKFFSDKKNPRRSRKSSEIIMPAPYYSMFFSQTLVAPSKKWNVRLVS